MKTSAQVHIDGEVGVQTSVQVPTDAVQQEKVGDGVQKSVQVPTDAKNWCADEFPVFFVSNLYY